MVVYKIQKKSSGFTLIELVLVIAIIIVLTGVLLAVINPARMKNQANDATIVSTLNKLALTTSGYISSYGYAPNEYQFFDALNAVATQYGGNDCMLMGAADYTCLFKVDGIDLPDTCNGGHWTGSSSESTDCYMRYYSGMLLPENTVLGRNFFRIYAKSLAMPNSIFVFDSSNQGYVYVCPYSIRDVDSLALCSAL
jgi:type II secretory pathway pseudopilin PulG